MADEQPQKSFWERYGPMIVWAAITALFSVISAVTGRELAPVPPPVVIERLVFQPEGPETQQPPPAPGQIEIYPGGWVDDPDAVAAVKAALVQPVFAATPAGQVETVPDHVYLWDLSKAALGASIPTRNQGGVGSCVAFGSACAVEYNQCAQIVAAKKASRPPPEFKPVSTEVIYGGSRVQIGGGRIRGDGSVGAWGAEWCKQYGSVARGVYGNIDLTAYSESRCRAYGRSGCPKELLDEAKKYPTKTISQVRTVDECKRALASGYPVTVASDVGFGRSGPYTRNAKGQLFASGSWAHQMCIIGYDKDAGFCIMNSWGPDWVNGPSGPGSPPPGSFYATENTVARMLAQNDSWAYGDQTGFPARLPDWFVQQRPERFRPLDLFAFNDKVLAW